ncbi:DUF427 domain-containing protein [Longispora sp. NPDC051575]|uniref:DUF427 domain-containing protein n=1 Tax=Longispora sp. NPDC051575 TaxID=3154943 RepID=UPI00343FAC89
MRVRAVFNGVVLADSDDTVVVEGNRYFPPESLRMEHFTPARTRSICPWKGIASYYTITVDGVVNPDAAWYYRHPTPFARRVRNRVAFWNGVTVETVEETT